MASWQHRSTGIKTLTNLCRKAKSQSERPTATIALLLGIAVSGMAFACWCCRRSRTLSSAEHDPSVHPGQPKWFLFQELQVATNNFSDENILGGKVYRGRLEDGSLVAVKRMKKESVPGGVLEYQTKMEMIGMAFHRSILRPHGFCITATERLQVYPYMANGSVASCLRDRSPQQPPLFWPTRKRIALTTARALSYLHQRCNKKIIHRNVKAANVLLDEDFEAFVGDFGLAKLMEHKDTEVITSLCGTLGHIAPEYLSTGRCSEKTDVYAYGILLLELITGQKAFDLSRLASEDDNVMLLDWVQRLVKKKRLGMLVDPEMENNYVEAEIQHFIQVALHCTEDSAEYRPNISEVVRLLDQDVLAERWIQWQKVDLSPQGVDSALRPGYGQALDSTQNLLAEDLSGPR